ncbi:hypothetical protein G0V41_03940 [Staphylococcus aureus]|nr:hypothetical protein [Staphylococcus aureus]NGL67935.1 hypothetical protein [Staphylococcus aureus]
MMQSSKWNAMSLLMDEKTKQAEVLRTAGWSANTSIACFKDESGLVS